MYESNSSHITVSDTVDKEETYELYEMLIDDCGHLRLSLRTPQSIEPKLTQWKSRIRIR